MIDPPDAPLGFAALPGELRARIEAELAPGERLLWAAQSGSKPAAALLDPIKPGLLGLIALGISLVATWFGVFPPASLQGKDISGLVVVGFVAAMVALIAFAVGAGAWTRRRDNQRPDRRQLFALTDRRAVTWEPEDRAGGIEVYSIEPIHVRTVHRLEYADGTGEIRIDFFGDASGEAPWLPRKFVGIVDVRRVEALAREVLISRTLPRPERSPARGEHPFQNDPDAFEEPF